MGNYKELGEAFGNKRTYKYDNTLSCDGTKIICSRGDWVKNSVTEQWGYDNTEDIVLAEWIEYKGKSYAVVYNRGNKCFATEYLWGYTPQYIRWRGSSPPLKYGEIGKPTKEQQVSYRCQMIDSLIQNGAVTHILIPTSYNGDSTFFKKL